MVPKLCLGIPVGEALLRVGTNGVPTLHQILALSHLGSGKIKPKYFIRHGRESDDG